jgi:hypothetical protein
VDGAVDWTTWTAQVREKVGGPDLERRLGLAREHSPTLAELQTAVRYADAGYEVELLVAVENERVRNPDMKVQHPDWEVPTWVEVKHRAYPALTKNSLNYVITEANKQIRGAGMETVYRGHIVVDASTAPGKITPPEMERFLNGKLTSTDSHAPQLLQIDYIEVLYRDPIHGRLLRSSIMRGSDGRTAAPFTEDCEEQP